VTRILYEFSRLESELVPDVARLDESREDGNDTSDVDNRTKVRPRSRSSVDVENVEKDSTEDVTSSEQVQVAGRKSSEVSSNDGG